MCEEKEIRAGLGRKRVVLQGVGRYVKSFIKVCVISVRDQQEARHRVAEAEEAAGGCAPGVRGDGPPPAEETPGSGGGLPGATGPAEQGQGEVSVTSLQQPPIHHGPITMPGVSKPLLSIFQSKTILRIPDPFQHVNVREETNILIYYNKDTFMEGIR